MMSSPDLVSCRMRFSVRLTTPSILGKKTSAIMAMRMGSLHFSLGCLPGQNDRDAVMIDDGEDESVQQPTRDGPCLVQSDRFDNGREPAASIAEFHELI